MKFKEYIASERFQREMSDLGKGKKWNKLIIVGWLIGVAFLVGALVCLELLPEELRTDGLGVLGIVLGAIGVVVLIALSFFGAKFSGRDDNGRRKPVYAVAMLLYARENLADGWRVDNGLIAFSISVTTEEKGKELKSVTLERGGERTEVDLAAFNGSLEVLDITGLILCGLFAFLERSPVPVTAIRSTFRLNEREGKPIFLYRNGKWTLTGKLQKGEYLSIERYARKKGIYEE